MVSSRADVEAPEDDFADSVDEEIDLSDDFLDDVDNDDFDDKVDLEDPKIKDAGDNGADVEEPMRDSPVVDKKPTTSSPKEESKPPVSSVPRLESSRESAPIEKKKPRESGGGIALAPTPRQAPSRVAAAAKPSPKPRPNVVLKYDAAKDKEHSTSTVPFGSSSNTRRTPDDTMHRQAPQQPSPGPQTGRVAVAKVEKTSTPPSSSAEAKNDILISDTVARYIALGCVIVTALTLFFTGCFTDAPESNWLLFCSFALVSPLVSVSVVTGLSALTERLINGVRVSDAESPPLGTVIDVELIGYLLRKGKTLVTVLILCLCLLISWAAPLLPSRSGVNSDAYDAILRILLMAFIVVSSVSIAALIYELLILLFYTSKPHLSRTMSSIVDEFSLNVVATRLAVSGKDAPPPTSPTAMSSTRKSRLEKVMFEDDDDSWSSTSNGRNGVMRFLPFKALAYVARGRHYDTSGWRRRGAFERDGDDASCVYVQDIIRDATSHVRRGTLHLYGPESTQSITITSAAAAAGFGRQLFGSASLSSTSLDGSKKRSKSKGDESIARAALAEVMKSGGFADDTAITAAELVDSIFGVGNAPLTAVDFEDAIEAIWRRRDAASKTLTSGDDMLRVVAGIVLGKLLIVDMVLLLIVLEIVRMSAVAVFAAALVFIFTYTLGRQISEVFMTSCVFCCTLPFCAGDVIALAGTNVDGDGRGSESVLVSENTFEVLDIGLLETQLRHIDTNADVHMPTLHLMRPCGTFVSNLSRAQSHRRTLSVVVDIGSSPRSAELLLHSLDSQMRSFLRTESMVSDEALCIGLSGFDTMRSLKARVSFEFSVLVSPADMLRSRLAFSKVCEAVSGMLVRIDDDVSDDHRADVSSSPALEQRPSPISSSPAPEFSSSSPSPPSTTTSAATPRMRRYRP